MFLLVLLPFFSTQLVNERSLCCHLGSITQTADSTTTATPTVTVAPPPHTHIILHFAYTHTVPPPSRTYFFSLPVDLAGRTALHLAAAAGDVSVVVVGLALSLAQPGPAFCVARGTMQSTS